MRIFLLAKIETVWKVKLICILRKSSGSNPNFSIFKIEL